MLPRKPPLLNLAKTGRMALARQRQFLLSQLLTQKPTGFGAGSVFNGAHFHASDALANCLRENRNHEPKCDALGVFELELVNGDELDIHCALSDANSKTKHAALKTLFRKCAFSN